MGLKVTDWTSGEPIEKEWAMTDPALRALVDKLRVVEVVTELDGYPGIVQRRPTDEELALLAAAEAAPLHHRIGTDPDCEWCQRFIAATHPYEAGADNVCIHCGVVGSYGHTETER